MKGVRLYREHNTPRDKRRKRGNGNVVAVFHENGMDRTWTALGAIYAHPNSPVATCGASPDYLRTRCTRIPEALARVIHPRLFERLDED